MADLSDEDSDSELIEVDNEARILHDERFIEGEQVELPPINRRRKKTEAFVPPPDLPTKNNDAYGWKTVQLAKDKKQNVISQGLKVNPMTPRDVTKVANIWSLSEN